MKQVLLIDGNSMLFRAYYASAYGKKMQTSSMIPTNAVFSFVTMLNKALELIQPDMVLVAWDAGKATFRHEMYSEYKGTRKELDPDLKVQFPIVREFLDCAHIKRYECEGIEADDIIGSFVEKYQDVQIHILSSDKDLLQLITHHAKVYLMKKGISDLEIYDEAYLYERMSITPKQIIDLKALMGDSADNIPGIKGVGDKTATDLLKKYQSVENIYEHVDELKGKLKEKIVNGKESAMLSKELATIKTDAFLPFMLDELNYNGFNEEVNDFYKKYEMKSLIKKDVIKKQQQASMSLVTTITPSLLNDDSMILADYDNENFYEATLYGFAIGNDTQVEYISLNDALNDQALLTYLKDSNNKKTYDAKNFYHICHKYDLACGDFSFDLMLAAFLIDQSLTDLDKILLKYEIALPLSKDEVFGKKGKPCFVDLNEASKRLMSLLAQLYPYVNDLMKKLSEYEMLSLFQDIEMPLAKVLYEIEEVGFYCDVHVLNKIAQDYQVKIDEIAKQIYELANKEFNINSPKQLASVLFDDLGLKSGKKRSTAADVLEKLIDAHPMIPLLLQHRKYSKIYSTYAIGLSKHILSDQRIHTILNQNLTQTGRLSSSEPNLQNISVKDEEGKIIRQAFKAKEGCVLLSADYSQIELRMLAHMADEKVMIDAFNKDVDIHSATAMEIFDVSLDEVSASQRRSAKTVNFGIVYGQSDFGLSEQLNISRKEAKFFIEKYFASYPNIKTFMDETIEFCRTHGYVKTLFLRRRYINEINDSNYMIREFGKRAAMNAPVQGSAADLIKLAMISIRNKMKQLNVKSKMILQIHDELIFEVYEDELALMKEIVEQGMQEVYPLKVPLKAQACIAKNWYDAK